MAQMALRVVQGLMPISVFNLKRRPVSRAGYSLLEIIVVVAILGLAATLSGPSIGRMIAQQELRQVTRSVQADFSALRVTAFIETKTYSADDIYQSLNTDLPEGWSVRASEDLKIRSSGTCQGGRIDVLGPGNRTWPLNIRSGDCFISGAD